jgi:hypothetical protein
MRKPLRGTAWDCPGVSFLSPSIEDSVLLTSAYIQTVVCLTRIKIASAVNILTVNRALGIITELFILCKLPDHPMRSCSNLLLSITHTSVTSSRNDTLILRRLLSWLHMINLIRIRGIWPNVSLGILV